MTLGESPREAVRRLYVAHAAELRLGVARLAGRDLDPDDLLHEVFIVALRKPDDVLSADAPKAWLYGVAVKVAASRRRTAKLRRFLGLEDVHEVASAESSSRTAEQRDASKRVEQVLSKLSDKKREVLVLHELQGLPGEEIAAALQIPLKTVWTRLFHARKDFAAELARLELIEQRTSGLKEERHG
ncbi:MAG: RNA polymerase sigma factor [Myxococcaceae bacterium]|nr:RNA polymerase sigma factor [Myxococcaceae bacterium]